MGKRRLQPKRGNRGSTALLLVLGLGVMVIVGGGSFVRISGTRSRIASREVATTGIRRDTMAALEYFNQLVQSGVIQVRKLPDTDPMAPGLVVDAPFSQMNTVIGGANVPLYQLTPGTAGVLNGASLPAQFTVTLCNPFATPGSAPVADLVNLSAGGGASSIFQCPAQISPTITVTGAGPGGGTWSYITAQAMANGEANRRLSSSSTPQLAGYLENSKLSIPTPAPFTPPTCTVGVKAGSSSSLLLPSDGSPICTDLEVTFSPNTGGTNPDVTQVGFDALVGGSGCGSSVCTYSPAQSFPSPSTPTDTKICFTAAGSYTPVGRLTGAVPATCTGTTPITVTGCGGSTGSGGGGGVQTLTQTASIAQAWSVPLGTVYIYPANFNQFNPSMGTLQSVSISYTLRDECDVTLTEFPNVTCDLSQTTANLQNLVATPTGDTATYDTVGWNTTRTYHYGPGPRPNTWLPLSNSYQLIQDFTGAYSYTTAAQLAPFVGGGTTSIGLQVISQGMWTGMSDCGNGDFSTMTYGIFNATITYSYLPPGC